MGIRNLYSYILGLPGSYKTVNIIDELLKYKKETNENPVIIINLWTLSNFFSLSASDEEKLFGNRLSQIKSDFENFLINLRLNGAKLYFVFKKSQCKEWDFIETSEYNCAQGIKILDVTSDLKMTKDVAKRIQSIRESNRSFNFPPNQPIIMVLVQTAKRYGTIIGMDSSKSIPSTTHVQLANKHKALAMIGTDTYYIFHDGPWKYWCDFKLDMKNMTIQECNREYIREQMRITVEQAPLFATLAGGLYSTAENVKTVYKHFKPWTRKHFEAIADFISGLSFPITDEALVKIVNEIFYKTDQQIVKDFRRTLDLMNPSNENKNKSEHRNNEEIINISDNDLFNFASQILANEAIFLSPTFLDLR